MFTVNGDYGEELYSEIYQDSLMAQAVNVPVIDSLANGRLVKNSSLNDALQSLSVINVMREAGILARVFGECLVIPVLATLDNKKLSFSKPIDEVNGFKVLKVIFTKDFEKSDDKITDPFSPNFGEHSYYTVNGNKIHPSRAALITANRSGVSFIKTIYRYFCDFEERNFETTKAVRENNFILLYTDIALLHEIAEANIKAHAGERNISVSEEAYNLLNTRIKELNQNKNSNNGYGLDKEGEKIDILLRTNINQLVEAVNNSLEIFSAVVDIPASRLLGKRTNSGLTSDNSDLVYVQTLTGLRDFMFSDALKLIDGIVAKAIGVTDTSYEWNKFAFEKTNTEKTAGN